MQLNRGQYEFLMRGLREWDTSDARAALDLIEAIRRSGRDLSYGEKRAEDRAITILDQHGLLD